MESLKIMFEEAPSFVELLVRLVFNSVVSFVILHFIYQNYNKKKSFVFNLFIFNLVIFGLSTVLTRIELSVGSGFGLRFDLKFFLFRTDLGLKMRDPSRFANDRWIFQQNKVMATDFALSIAIAYPF
mgnify:CR=1 FL=1